MNDKWTGRFLAMAELAAAWSKDPSTQVGAVVADDMHRVVSMGYNGLPRGVVDRPMDRDEKLRRVIHAEENALLFAGRAAMAATIYVTHHPCARCAAKIIQAGIWRVVCADRPLRPEWQADITSARDMLAEASVQLQIVPTKPTPRDVWADICGRARVVRAPSTRARKLILDDDMINRMGDSLGLSE